MKKLLFGCMTVLLVTGMALATRTMFLNHTSGTCTPYLDTGTLTANWYNDACGSKTTAWTSNSGWACQGSQYEVEKYTCGLNCCCDSFWTDNDSRTIDDACDISSMSKQVFLNGFCD